MHWISQKTKSHIKSTRVECIRLHKPSRHIPSFGHFWSKLGCKFGRFDPHGLKSHMVFQGTKGAYKCQKDREPTQIFRVHYNEPMSSTLMKSLTALQKKTPGKFVNETSGPKTMTFILSVRLNVSQTTDSKRKSKCSVSKLVN